MSFKGIICCFCEGYPKVGIRIGKMLRRNIITADKNAVKYTFV